MERTKTAVIPSGRLRISLPLGGMFLMSIIGDFIGAFPAIVLDLDFSPIGWST